MRNKFLFLSIGLIFSGGITWAEAQVKVTYIANDGYMFEEGIHKVIVDCMFYISGSDHWHSPDKNVYEKMIKGEKPFDNITAIIVTHDHGDHYNPDMVAGYLSSFSTTLIAPPQAVASLKQSRLFTAGKSTILTAPANFYQSREFEVGKLKLTALTLHHVGSNRSTQNMVAAIDFGGLTILHAGDANLDDLYEAKFPHNDMVMLSYWQGFEIDVMEKINKNIKSKHVIFKHAPYPTIAESILGNIYKEWEEMLSETESDIEKINILQEILVKLLSPSYIDDKVIDYTSRHIVMNNGNISINKIAEKIGISSRQLNRKFSTKVGLSPKSFSRIIRFQAVVRALMKHKTADFASATYNYGFFDQSHFNKEFKALSGTTPKNFFSRDNHITG